MTCRRALLPLLLVALIVGVPSMAAAGFVPVPPPGIWIPLDPPGLFHRCWIVLVGWIVPDGPPTADAPPGRTPVYGGEICQICPPEFFPDGCP